MWEQDRIDIAEGQQVLVRCIKYYSDERVHVWRILKIHEGYVSDDLEIREHAPYLLASNPTIENQDIRSTYNSAERTTLEPKRAVRMITIVSLTKFIAEDSSIFGSFMIYVNTVLIILRRNRKLSVKVVCDTLHTTL